MALEMFCPNKHCNYICESKYNILSQEKNLLQLLFEKVAIAMDITLSQLFL